ncbi:UDP-N-acetyl-D-mannosamine transferase [Dulcicalothrix desertica PCC 7102]|uniref:UDP-N-acetyl-D-mannosamine transferase n=1 Tax=Dulcicalothrix desertica PCC 7102 TaxID=232991 RepID=A0A433V6R1_9CYAN|nr:WecB/TagA/CpsF family glycosyltransferase [Dulcicalothrix desertica]RUT01790.1 UDP-N-acetyl-D-mannosamine transferase [Dulcicalothrix desertica PCC 7102]TWH42942.1 N-acetylglucosaminyldiphosphoundecaprenol N-acetyl-beta-D-mannosaminyltransferase [Dulcicalothrix desertica PCC 7102]
MNRIKLLNCFYDTVTFDETLDWASEWIKNEKQGYIATVNVAISIMMRSNHYLRNFINNASLVVADGQPIVWASRLFALPIPERVTGVDLVEGLAVVASKEDFHVFLLGAEPEVIETVVKKLQQKYNRLNICGFHHGYFSNSETPKIVEAIKQSQAQILIVGMGVPRQENFIQENFSQLGVNLAIGVGGTFQVIAGTKRRAPLWMQQVGLEWFYRLLQEPGRLWKRYLVTNSQFLFYLALEILGINIHQRRDS